VGEDLQCPLRLDLRPVSSTSRYRARGERNRRPPTGAQLPQALPVDQAPNGLWKTSLLRGLRWAARSAHLQATTYTKGMVEFDDLVNAGYLYMCQFPESGLGRLRAFLIRLLVRPGVGTWRGKRGWTSSDYGCTTGKLPVNVDWSGWR